MDKKELILKVLNKYAERHDNGYQTRDDVLEQIAEELAEQLPSECECEVELPNSPNKVFGDYGICSICKEKKINLVWDGVKFNICDNYCPNCGAKIKRADNGEEK